MTGEVLADAGEILSREKATMMAARGVNSVVIESAEGTAVKVFGNGMVDVNDFSEYLGGATAEDCGHQGEGSLHRPQGDHRLRRTAATS